MTVNKPYLTTVKCSEGIQEPKVQKKDRSVPQASEIKLNRWCFAECKIFPDLESLELDRDPVGRPEGMRAAVFISRDVVSDFQTVTKTKSLHTPSMGYFDQNEFLHYRSKDETVRLLKMGSFEMLLLIA